MPAKIAVRLLPALLIFTASWNVNAADPAPAATSLSEVDEDFVYQGEYDGYLKMGPGRYERVGLQVVALGDGAFQAVEYRGGLPGSGWDRKLRHKLTGKREDGIVTLSAAPITITVDGSTAQVHDDSSDIDMGRLKKTQRISPTLGAPPPWNATVLFDGVNPPVLKNAKVSEDGLLMEGTETLEAYRDFTMHVEFRLPYMPKARGQGRSNSGVYLQSRYEVQILDSFGLDGVDNECGALYKYVPPAVNMCLPPLAWQTYDIDFRSPRFDDAGNKIENARLTVRHNGVYVHHKFSVERKTGGGAQEGPKPLVTKFQDHRNPVRFRNMWIVKHSEDGSAATPAVPLQAAHRSTCDCGCGSLQGCSAEVTLDPHSDIFFGLFK